MTAFHITQHPKSEVLLHPLPGNRGSVRTTYSYELSIHPDPSVPLPRHLFPSKHYQALPPPEKTIVYSSYKEAQAAALALKMAQTPKQA